MSTKNNDVLGYITCEAGGRATVHKTTRGKGRFFYTRCDCCGCDQRNGAAVQSRIYNQTQWLGEKPESPPNYLGSVVEPSEPSISKVPDEIEQPKNEPEIQPEIIADEPREEPKGSFVFFSIAGLLLGGLAIAIGRA